MTTTWTAVEERIVWTATEDPSYQFVTLRPTSVTLTGGGGLELGETSSTAHRGDHGATAYTHSQTAGNPHGTTASDVGAAATSHAHSGTDITSGLVAPSVLGTGAANDTTFLRGDGVWASEVPAWARMPPPYPMAAGTYVGLRSTINVWSYAVGSMTVIRLWLPPAFDRLAIHAASGGNSTFRLGWYEQQAGDGAIDWASKVDCGTVNTTSAGIAATTVPGGTQTGGRWVYAACLRETATANPTLQVNTSDPDLKGLRFAINNEPVAGMRTPSVATGSLPASQPAIWDMFWSVASVFARVA